jgi:acyl-CoA synthetase (AMP-forming)/AMP-acid ligase II
MSPFENYVDVLPPGAIGRICIQTPSEFQGYVESLSIQDGAASTRGYLETSDIGFFDERGELFVVGRLDNRLNLGGRKIAAELVENALKSLSGIWDACVVQWSDPQGGDVVHAIVQAKDLDRRTFWVSIEEAFQRERIHPIFSPRGVILRDVPKNQNGKTDRQEARNIIESCRKFDLVR